MLPTVDTPGPLRPAQERALRAMDAIVVDEAARLREGLDASRHRLREALLAAARDVVQAGDASAATVVALGHPIAHTHADRGDDERARRVALAARLAHDRVRSAASRLAAELRAMEGDLAVPLARAARQVQVDGLAVTRRSVEDAVRAADGDDGLEAVVAAARDTARAQVDAALGRLAEAAGQGTAAIHATVDGLPGRLVAATERTVPAALEAVAREVEPPARRWWARALVSSAAAIALLLVVSTALLSYGIGLAVAGALFGAIVLTGTYAPPVGAGFVAAAVGTLLAAGVTDLLFNVLGEWRSGRDDGLLGAHVSVLPRGRLPRPVDLSPVLAVLRLSPRALVPDAPPDLAGR